MEQLTSSRAGEKKSADLFAEEVLLSLPSRYALCGQLFRNPLEQLAQPAESLPCKLQHFAVKHVAGLEGRLPSGELLRIIPRRTATRIDADLLLLVPGAVQPSEVAAALGRGEGTWLAPASAKAGDETLAQAGQRTRQVIASWKDAFTIREGRLPARPDESLPGLRRPQVGAIHAALAHATRSTDPATIVMPTGTGKTETMLALEVVQSIDRLLVVVPNDALRDQIADKFLSLGVLKRQGCLAPTAAYPVVLRLAHRPRTVAEVDELFGRANVVVTTIQIAGQAAAEIQERIALRASRLFIDEVHHIAARTWAEFRSLFEHRGVPIIQFTATPFREDGRRVDGEFIYTYPLRKAQGEGYFKPIRFEAVFGLDQAETDEAIMAKLGEVLAADLEAGRNHLAIVRCRTIERAKQLHERYAARFPEYAPLLVHSQLTARERRERLAALGRFDRRVVVCVDMLGEGFDLPELKIAAIHDHHKSIAVTIQFVGRLTRPDPLLGDATVIANTGIDDIDRALAKLYAEDADWNALVEALSTSNIERQVRRSEMLKGFVGDIQDIPLQTLDPSMNAFVYTTKCTSWDPHRAEDLFEHGTFLGMKVNQAKRVAVFVTREESQARWTAAGHAVNVAWNLHLLHWDEAKNLLFINSSAKGPFDKLATAVCGEGARRVTGDDVFRAMHDFKRLIIRNLGLTHQQGRGVRYSMFMGVDVAEGLDSAKAQGRIKNNAFAAGFVDGVPATLGCSTKGKFWSFAPVRDLTDWVDWCHGVGNAVTDTSLTTDNVFKGAMRPRQIRERPEVPPVAIHWPESLLLQFEERVQIGFGGKKTSFAECDIELVSHERIGPLQFRVKSDTDEAVFEIVFADAGACYPQREGLQATVIIGNKEMSLSEFFGDDAPQIDFGDGSLLIYSHLYSLPDGQSLPPYDRAKLEAWDWSAANIRRESQGIEKHADSIQRLVIDRLLEDQELDIVFDDDGSGEIADVVTMRIGENLVTVTVFRRRIGTLVEIDLSR